MYASMRAALSSFMLLRNVAVDIQGKGCGSVSKIALHGLDIIPILKGEDGERVTEIVHPAIRDADGGGDLLEVIADGAFGKCLSAFRCGEHQGGLPFCRCLPALPYGTGFQALRRLLPVLPVEAEP